MCMCLGMVSCNEQSAEEAPSAEPMAAVFADEHDLTGIWKCERIAPKGTHDTVPDYSDYSDMYKMIDGDYFLYFDIPKDADGGVGVRFNIKCGPSNRVSESVLMEGTESVPTYLDGENMCLEWMNGETLMQEVWKKATPNEYVQGAIEAMLPKENAENHEFNGVWKLVTDSTANTHLYKVVNGDKYIWYNYNRRKDNVEFWNCSCGSFERLATTVTLENGTLYIPVVWISEDKNRIQTFFDIDSDGRNFAFQVWERAELPQSLREVTEFVTEHFVR